MRARRFIPLLLVAAALLAYSDSFRGPFIYDDQPSILTNPSIRHLWPLWKTLSPPHEGGITVEARPVLNLSLAVNYAFGGTNVVGYHVFNLVIHILVGLTLYGILGRTLRLRRLNDRYGTGADGLAFAATLLWLVHPLQTEAVTYVIQRAESLMGLFYLLTLYCFIRGVESPAHPRAWAFLCVAACALGMATKEVMASAPLVVLLYDRAFISGSFSEVWRRRRALYLALGSTWVLLGYLIIAWHFRSAVSNARTSGFQWWQYLLTEPGAILHYLRLSVWPSPLCFDYYGWPIAKTWKSVWPQILVLLILLAAITFGLRRNSVWGFLGAAFFLILIPSSSVVPVDYPVYEHRMYLSLAAVLLLIVLGIFFLLRQYTPVVVAVLAISLGILTWRRNLDYRSDLAIWQDTVNKRPANPRAHTNLGLAMADVGQIHDAIAQYYQALRLQPNSATARYNLELALARVSRVDESIAHYEQALRIKPDSAEAHDGLGLALAQSGKTAAAIDHFEQAIRLNPQDARVYNNLAVALIQSGRTQEAIESWRHALQLQPDDAETQFNLGNALLSVGQTREAIEHWQKAVNLKPDFAVAKESLARLTTSLGQTNSVTVPMTRDKKDGR